MTPFAAPASTEADDALPEEEAGLHANTDLDALCEAWASWTRTRRFYVKPSVPPSVLGRLRSKGTGRSTSGGPDAVASAQLLAFNLAVHAQPREALDRQVFELHYLHRVASIKTAADLLGISRNHWYRLLRAFRDRAYSASCEILSANLQAAQELPSQQRAQ
jgi:hypothetical protein